MNQLVNILNTVLYVLVIVAIIAALSNYLRADIVPFMTYDKQMFVFGFGLGVLISGIIKSIPRGI